MYAEHLTNLPNFQKSIGIFRVGLGITADLLSASITDICITINSVIFCDSVPCFTYISQILFYIRTCEGNQ